MLLPASYSAGRSYRVELPNVNRPEANCDAAEDRSIVLLPPEKPGLYLDEMAVFLWDEFQTLVTVASIRQALVAKSWSKKTARQRAREQNADLHDYYLYNYLTFNPITLYMLMNPDVINEPGLDARVGHRLAGRLCR